MECPRPWASSGPWRDYPIDVPAKPTLPDAYLRYKEALDWCKWTKGRPGFESRGHGDSTVTTPAIDVPKRLRSPILTFATKNARRMQMDKRRREDAASFFCPRIEDDRARPVKVVLEFMLSVKHACLHHDILTVPFKKFEGSESEFDSDTHSGAGQYLNLNPEHFAGP